MSAGDARIDAFDLSVMLDIRHPFAYLALVSTCQWARRTAVSINWLPIEAPPLNPPGRSAPDEDRGVRHRRSRAEAIAREIDLYASAAGLVLREPYRAPDARRFQSLWLWVRHEYPDPLPALLLEAFRAYWALELDPSDRRALERLATAIGLDTHGFSAWSQNEGAACVTALAAELATLGIAGSPCFRVGDETFLGRQHLPMIEWILAGRSRPIPI